MVWMMDFFDEIKNRDIICWGSGKYYRNHTYPFLCESGLLDNVRGVVDTGANAGKGAGRGTGIGAGTVRDALKELIHSCKREFDDIVILIAVEGYREIQSQLRAEPELAGYWAVPSTFLEALYEDMQMLLAPKPPMGFRKNMEETIPRVIHTFWFSEEELSGRYRHCLESWKRFAPDFEIKIWNQNTYSPDNCEYYEQAIEKKYWAFASDYARADVLRRHGGIYMDLDVEILRPIDDLLYNDAYMSFESLKRVECGSGMGAKAGNRILDEICKDYESRPFIKGDGSPDMSTCPVRYTKILEKHGLVKNGGFQMVEDITVYPFETLTGKSFDTGIIYSTQSSYTLHHHNGSWVPGHTQNAMHSRYVEIEKFLTEIDKQKLISRNSRADS